MGNQKESASLASIIPNQQPMQFRKWMDIKLEEKDWKWNWIRKIKNQWMWAQLHCSRSPMTTYDLNILIIIYIIYIIYFNKLYNHKLICHLNHHLGT